MAEYKSKQSIFDEALGEYKDRGFSLVAPDDHILELHYNGKRINYFNQTQATFEILKACCHTHLVNSINNQGKSNDSWN